MMLNGPDREEIAGIERILRQVQQNAKRNETVAAFLASIKAELRDRATSGTARTWCRGSSLEGWI